MAVVVVCLGTENHGPPPEPRTTTDISGVRFAVTNSWLECCLRDIAGPPPPDADVARLCPPGSCPGHFDIKPGDAAVLMKCQALFRFDFQKSLDARIQGLRTEGPAIISIPAPDGLCIPDRYLESCESIHDELARLEPGRRAVFDAALTATRARLSSLSAQAHATIADARLPGVRVVVSGRQAAFCRWLGLDTVSAYSGGEAASPAQLRALVEKGRDARVRFVITNLQEGRQMGEALAYHLGAQVVVFSNFPDMTSSQNSFDALVNMNIQALISAAGAIRHGNRSASTPSGGQTRTNTDRHGEP
ncbi:MAG: zinc ABC transporter substrate-binding protein [bacterium]|nr:zinc ABC transporter substrate-binding protein [Candidatus Sumerlaeota bacterium]